MNNQLVKQIIEEFKCLDGVIAITLAGSIANDTNDESSDIDLDIFYSKPIPVEKRSEILSKYTKYAEVGNEYFGPNDEMILSDDTVLDVVYFEWEFIKSNLERVVTNHEASVGYTTCFWHNVMQAKIVYDDYHLLQQLKDKYNVNYPLELKQNIVLFNYPLLRKNIASYKNQIAKALKRDDLVSVNHRVAALFASYFDILFALNEIKHPGEKKLIKILSNRAKYLPSNFEVDINTILKKASLLDESILEDIDLLVEHLDELIIENDLL